MLNIFKFSKSAKLKINIGISTLKFAWKNVGEASSLTVFKVRKIAKQKIRSAIIALEDVCPPLVLICVDRIHLLS